MRTPNNTSATHFLWRNFAEYNRIKTQREELSKAHPSDPKLVARKIALDEAMRKKLTSLIKQNKILKQYRSAKSSKARKKLWKKYVAERKGYLGYKKFQKVKPGSICIACKTEKAVEKLKFDANVERINKIAEKPRADRTAFEKAELCKLLAGTPPDRAFAKRNSANKKRMAKYLKKLAQKDPLVKKAKADWGSLTMDEKKKVARKILRAQRKAYKPKMKAPKLRVFDRGPVGGLITNGSYWHGSNKIKLNKNAEAKFGASFEKAVNLLCHEQGHKYQQTLVDLLKAGKIKKGSPLYRQAQLWRVNFETYQSTELDDSFYCYQGQSVEKDARNAGAAGARAVK